MAIDNFTVPNNACNENSSSSSSTSWSMLISVSRRVPGGIQGERAKEGPASGKVSFVVVVETGVKNFDPSGRVRNDSSLREGCRPVTSASSSMSFPSDCSGTGKAGPPPVPWQSMVKRLSSLLSALSLDCLCFLAQADCSFFIGMSCRPVFWNMYKNKINNAAGLQMPFKTVPKF